MLVRLLSGHARAFQRSAIVFAIIAAVALAGCAVGQPARALRIATASTSHTLCSGLFVSGRDSAQTYLEEMRPEPGMGLIDWGLRYRVDRERREVTAMFRRRVRRPRGVPRRFGLPRRARQSAGRRYPEPRAGVLPARRLRRDRTGKRAG
jgi:hypothetical protein